MKTKLILCSLLAAGTLFGAHESRACTNVIVTPGASADGSCLVSYAADSHVLYGELYFHPEKDWKPGSKLKIIEWDSYKPLGEIYQVAHTYKTVGNMNEHQLIITETTFGGRSELADPNGIMDYGSLIYITLQRAKTAREAIDVMTDLVNRYGYYSGGETFSIADKNEAWIMEMVGKGESRPKDPSDPNRGAVWVAIRVPDGYICSHANQSRITTFPLNDPDNCIYAKDVITFAREKGWYSGADQDFSFADAYCPLDFGGMRACEARVWSAYNILTDGKFTFAGADGMLVTRNASEYLDFAMGHNPKNRMPLFVKPTRKLSVKDVADVMRDHFEGTPMDMTTDIGAGGNALPYRWRPMNFEYKGNKYVNERAIATQQTGFWLVGQARAELPDVIGGIIWFGTDDAATSYLTPVYTNVNSVPDCFKEGNGDLLNYSNTSSFWINNRVSNSCYRMYNIMAPEVRARIDQFENDQLKAIKVADEKALELYAKAQDKQAKTAEKKGNDPDLDLSAVKRFLTNYSSDTAQNQFKAWRDLEVLLLVKFIDGNVKAQNPSGAFKHSKYSEKVPDGLTQPGYTDKWKEAVAKDHGDVLKAE